MKMTHDLSAILVERFVAKGGGLSFKSRTCQNWTRLGPNLPYGTAVPGVLRLDGKTFLWTSFIFGRKCSKNSKSTRGPTRSKAVPGNGFGQRLCFHI